MFRVYKITNPDCNDIYIGGTKQRLLSKRMNRHKEEMVRNPQRYGDLIKTPNYKIEVIEYVEKEKDLVHRERNYQDLYRSPQSPLHLVNHNLCACTPEDKLRRIKESQTKYNQSTYGRAKKKEQNKRYAEKLRQKKCKKYFSTFVLTQISH